MAITKKILIVDDEQDMVQLLTVELEQQNFEVVCAYDGEEGYAKYVDEKPDLIILDLMLPQLNGFEVCRRIRRDDEDEETPILMLTAKKEDADRIIGRVIGAEKYVTKPFEPEKLLQAIRELLDE